MIKIYGKNCVYEAIMAKSDIKEIYLLDDMLKKDKNILDIITKAKYKYNIVNKKKFFLYSLVLILSCRW